MSKAAIVKYPSIAAITVALLSFSHVTRLQAAGPVADQAHIPPEKSAEREAILQGLRDGREASFKLDYVKVHKGWAWVDATPLDRKGKPVAEGGTSLLHLEKEKWKVVDLSKVPEDPTDPMAQMDVSPGFVKNLLKTYPEVPKDILPKPHR